MTEIKEVKAEKTTVNAGERIHISFEFGTIRTIHMITRTTIQFQAKESEEETHE